MKESLRHIGARSLRRLRDEDGIALVFAMLVSTALAIMTTSVLYFSAASARTSSRSSADQQAYSLAEAGINTAVAKIYGATDPRVTTILPAGTVGAPAVVVPKCPGSNPNEVPTCYTTGSVTYSGTLDTTHGNTWYWTITSIGSVPVSGVATVVRKLTRTVGVTGNNGTDGSSWSRFYQNATSPCLTLDAISVPTNFASKGDVCLIDGATVTGTNTNIMAGGHIYIDPPFTDSPGTASNNTGWTNSSYAEVNDAKYAVTSSLANAATSANLDLTGLGFNVPSTATVLGFAVSIVRHASANSAANHMNDYHIQALKAGATAGTDHAITGTNWPLTTDGTQAYGTASDLWGTTWTPAQINASNFGIRIVTKSTCTTCGLTASVNAVTVTVYYTTGASIGSSGTPIALADVGTGCQGPSDNAPVSPCSSSDKVYATTVKTDTPANNPDLAMPVVDFNYWWANAMPGPKHFCTNANPGVSTTYFDNNASTTTKPDDSLTVNGEVAPPGAPYDCEVWQNGVLMGMLKWDGSHRMDIYGTIFFDGNFRFDQDGEIVHYFGRGTLMSSHDDEIDALVCAGGTGNTYATACNQNMNSWNPSQNMMVLMSNCMKGASGCNEYDQGGTNCSGSKPNCYDGHLVGGFQGILFSNGDCEIHQEFQDSGPVICNTISLPHESYNPSFYTFPSVGNLTDGMSYSSTSTATDFSLNVSAQSG